MRDPEPEFVDDGDYEGGHDWVEIPANSKKPKKDKKRRRKQKGNKGR